MFYPACMGTRSKYCELPRGRWTGRLHSEVLANDMLESLRQTTQVATYSSSNQPTSMKWTLRWRTGLPDTEAWEHWRSGWADPRDMQPATQCEDEISATIVATRS